MTVSPEQLAAYADGEIDGSAAALVEAELARSPELRAQLETHRLLKAKLAAHFSPIADRPAPEALIRAVRARSADNVLEFAPAAAERTSRRRAPPRWTWVAAPALAASIAILVIAPRSRPSDNYAAGQLAVALDRQLVESQRPDSPVRILLSFRDRGGRYCRAYDAPAAVGIACRDNDGWRVEKHLGGKAGPGTEYRQAGAPSDMVMTMAQEMSAGPALDGMEEAEAQRRGWRGN